LWVKHEYFEANYDRHESRRGAQSRVDQQNGSSGGRRRGGGMGTMIQNQLDRGDARTIDVYQGEAAHFSVELEAIAAFLLAALIADKNSN